MPVPRPTSVLRLISVLRRLSAVGWVIALLPLAGCAGKTGAYCAWDRQFTNCGYPTLESCRAAVSGVGSGYCGANPAYGTSKSR